MSLRTCRVLILAALSLSAAVVRAQPCSDTLVPNYGAGTLTGTINCGTVFDDHSGTGPALFIGGSAGGSLVVHQLAGTLVKLVNGHWVRNTTLGGSVTCLTVLDDGSGPALFVGGDFTIAPSTVHVNVAKWDGTTWTPFPTLNGGVTTIPVGSMIIHDDGSGAALYVGGGFSGVSLSSRGLAKWNGQAWTAVGAGVTSTLLPQIRTLKSFNDGTGNKLYVGGNITTAGGVPVTGLASWDGTTWAAVGPGFGSGQWNSDVYSLAVYDDGAGPGLYAAGVINLPDRHNGNSPVALWRGGSWSRVLGIGDGVNSNQGASALITLDDGTGSALYAAAGQVVEGANQVWRLHGGAWTMVGPAFSTTWPNAPFGATVNTFVAIQQPEGTRLISLGDTTNSGTAISPPATVWSNGMWRPVESGSLGLSPNPRLFSDEQARDGRLYASGLLLTDSGWLAQSGPDPIPTSPYVHLTVNGDTVTLTANAAGVWIKSNGLWQAFPSPGTGLVKLVAADDGSGQGLFAIMAGSWPNGSGGTDTGGRIEKWNGLAWDFVGPTVVRGGSGGAGGINGLASYDDGAGQHLYIGGIFAPMGSNVTPYFAEWIGGQWVPIDGVDGVVNDLLVFDVGSGPELILAGNFMATTGITDRGVSRWNGTRLAGIGTSGLGLSAIGNVLRIFDNGHGPRLWAGATGGNNGLNYWDGTNWVYPISPIFGTAFPSVTSLAEVDRPDGSRSLFIGGSFTNVNNVPSVNITELAVCRHSCTADFDGDGDSATDADIEAFFACLAGNCCTTCGSADFNDDGDYATDADIESFFRVLAGGAC